MPGESLEEEAVSLSKREEQVIRTFSNKLLRNLIVGGQTVTEKHGHRAGADARVAAYVAIDELRKRKDQAGRGITMLERIRSFLDWRYRRRVNARIRALRDA